MRGLLRFGRSVAIVALLVGANGLLLTELIGLPYSGFAWKVFAQAYDTGLFTDTDGDGIPDSQEPGRENFFDPSGCFYELGTGEIRSGGRVDVVSSPFLTTEDNGEDGCYSFISSTFGTFLLSATPPPFCRFPEECMPPFECPIGQGSCPTQGSFNPTDSQAAMLGAPINMSDPAFLESGACTPYFLEIVLDMDDLAVSANNIAVVCDFAPAPVLDGWSWGLLGLALLVVAYWGLQRRDAFQS